MMALILAGGRGTRLKAITPHALPKPMVPVAGKPILQHQIEFLAKHRIRKVVLSVGYRARPIKDFFGDGRRFGVSILYSEEKRPLGTAGAFKFAEPFLYGAGDVLVLYGDLIFDFDVARMFRFHRAHGGPGTILVHPNDHPGDSDLLEADREHRITRFIPKPHQSERRYRNLVNAGIYLLKPGLLKDLPGGRALDFGRDVFPAWVKRGVNIYAYKTPEYVKDAGSVTRHRQVEADLIRGKVRCRNLTRKQKAVFLEDEVLLKGALRPGRLKLINAAAAAVGKLNQSDFLSIGMISRFAAGVGAPRPRRVLDVLLGEQGAFLDETYDVSDFLESHVKSGINKRNGSSGALILKHALSAFNIEGKKSFWMGHRADGISAAVNAGLKTILVGEGGARDSGKCFREPDFIFENLEEAVDFILRTAEAEARIRF